MSAGEYERRFYLYEPPALSPAGELTAQCVEICRKFGIVRASLPTLADFAFAPHLTRRLSRAEYEAPVHGTLIFHPSFLPLHRGPDAVRWAVLGGERLSGATWFFASEEMDAGDVCEQEAVLLKPGESPGRAYHTRFVPAGLAAFERAVEGFVRRGIFRRRPQEHELATREGKWNG